MVDELNISVYTNWNQVYFVMMLHGIKEHADTHGQRRPM